MEYKIPEDLNLMEALKTVRNSAAVNMHDLSGVLEVMIHFGWLNEAIWLDQNINLYMLILRNEFKVYLATAK